MVLSQLKIQIHFNSTGLLNVGFTIWKHWMVLFQDNPRAIDQILICSKEVRRQSRKEIC